MHSNRQNASLLNKIETKHGKGKATKSFLRQEAVLKNNQNSFVFDFDANKTGNSAESRLSVQDSFYANAMGLFLIRDTDASPGSTPLRSWPDAAIFTAVTGFNISHLETVYNGFIRAEMGNQIVFDKLPAFSFRKNAAEFTEASGFEEIEPSLILFGNEKNRLTLIIPSFAGIQIEHPTAGSNHKVVMLLTGFVVPGGANAARG